MHKAVKFLHYLGLVMFLGSIVIYTMMSVLTEGAALTDLVFARRIITTGILAVTTPGLWLVAVTGAYMTLTRFGLGRHRWLTVKQVIMVVIILNTYVLILPAADEALRVAGESLAQGVLLPAYQAAYMRESVAGAVNVLLILMAMASGVWRYGKKS